MRRDRTLVITNIGIFIYLITRYRLPLQIHNFIGVIIAITIMISTIKDIKVKEKEWKIKIIFLVLSIVMLIQNSSKFLHNL